MNEIITSTISAAITAFVTYIFTRRKYLTEVRKVDKEADSSEIDNVEKAIRIWRQLSEDIKVRLTKDIEELRQENMKTREKLNTLIRENHALRHQMSNLEKELNLAKLENEKLHQLLKK